MKIKYEIPIKSKTGKTVMHTRTKNVDINGSVKKKSVGIYTSQFATKIYGARIIYLKKMKKGAGKGGRIKSRTYSKIVPIPKHAEKIRFVL